jgi:hypothetical protein
MKYDVRIGKAEESRRGVPEIRDMDPRRLISRQRTQHPDPIIWIFPLRGNQIGLFAASNMARQGCSPRPSRQSAPVAQIPQSPAKIILFLSDGRIASAMELQVEAA